VEESRIRRWVGGLRGDLNWWRGRGRGRGRMVEGEGKVEGEEKGGQEAKGGGAAELGV
jgi:hypothetical protein